MFRNMVTSLIEKERIRTTLAKAKELRSKVEKTITLGKKGTLHARRQALRWVHQKETVQKLFGPLAERFAQRNGGYTRIIRIGNRLGDDAPMAFIELIGPDEGKSKEPAKAKTKSAAKKGTPSTAGGKKTEKKKEKESEAKSSKKSTAKKTTKKKEDKKDKE